MGRVIYEDQRDSYERASFQWDKITHSLEPELAKLPKKDRKYFESKVKLLIGKEIRLSNIPPRHIYMYIRRGDVIIKTMRYPMLFDNEFIRSEIAKLLFRLGIRISEDGLGWKYGPMGFQESTVKQQVTAVPAPTMEGEK
jgi:hypothetical protein